MQETMSQEEAQKLLVTFRKQGKPNAEFPSQLKKATGKKSGGRYGKRHVDGEMNGTETAYSELLESQKQKGEIIEWFFEPISFRYAKGARFKADFMVMHLDCSIEFVDVKGGGPRNEAADCRAKACAEKFWMFAFSRIEKIKKSDEWKRTVF